MPQNIFSRVLVDGLDIPRKKLNGYLDISFLQLINGLADEKVRWQDTVQNLDYMINNIAGDVLASAGFVAYLGAFTVS